MEQVLQLQKKSRTRIRRDLTGEHFGKLTVLEYVKMENGGSKWKCQCDCGKTIEVRSTMLTSGHTTSCGCFKKELDGERDFKDVLTYINGTCIEFARDIGKVRTSTSADTGVRGVVLKDGKYQAQISFQRKRYYLGRYIKLEDAVEARRRAEYRVQEYVEEYLSGNPDPRPIQFDYLRIILTIPGELLTEETESVSILASAVEASNAAVKNPTADTVEIPVMFDLENVASPSNAIMKAGEDYHVALDPDDGYELPECIYVEIDDASYVIYTDGEEHRELEDEESELDLIPTSNPTSNKLTIPSELFDETTESVIVAVYAVEIEEKEVGSKEDAATTGSEDEETDAESEGTEKVETDANGPEGEKEGTDVEEIDSLLLKNDDEEEEQSSESQENSDETDDVTN